MKLYIKNMVCLCCKKTVETELNNMQLQYTRIELGEVDLVNPITQNQRSYLKLQLHEYGLELMEDAKEILVENIVAIIVNMIHTSKELPAVNFSVFLTNELNQDYHYLSTLFSKTKGLTIEHFIILHKIERVKELIRNAELSLTEISYRLNYCSVSHLSTQFKKITGLTPSSFKTNKNKKRIPLETLCALFSVLIMQILFLIM